MYVYSINGTGKENIFEYTLSSFEFNIIVSKFVLPSNSFWFTSYYNLVVSDIAIASFILL